MKRTVLTTLLTIASPLSLALDPACTILVELSEAKIAAPAWHAVSKLDDFETEFLKVDGKFFMKNAGEWMPAPFNMDETERKTIDSLRAGEIKVTGCTAAGEETVQGVRTRAFTYTVEVPGSGIPAVQTRINVGVDDGLPYRLSSAAGETKQHVTYRYSGVKTPL